MVAEKLYWWWMGVAEICKNHWDVCPFFDDPNQSRYQLGYKERKLFSVYTQYVYEFNFLFKFHVA